MASTENLFKFRQFPPNVILQSVRWYLRYNLSYRNLGEMLGERGIAVDHSTIYRWVQRYAPELDKRCRKHLKMTNDSWRLDETIIKIKGKRRYLWRAVDSEGNTLDFLLTARRNSKAAKRFFRKVLQQPHVQEPRVISTDKYVIYPKVIRELSASGELEETLEHRQVRYLNNIVEQDNRFVKGKVKVKMNFKNFWSAQRTIRGYEIMKSDSKGSSQRGAQRRYQGTDLFHQENLRIGGIRQGSLRGCFVTSIKVTTEPRNVRSNSNQHRGLNFAT